MHGRNDVRTRVASRKRSRKGATFFFARLSSKSDRYTPRPRTMWRMNITTAMTRTMWIRPPAMCMVNPSSQAMMRMTAIVRSISYIRARTSLRPPVRLPRHWLFYRGGLRARSATSGK